MPTIWEVLDREFHPSYNRAVLEQVLVEKGAIKGTAQKFWDDRDQTLAFKRRMVTGGSNGVARQLDGPNDDDIDHPKNCSFQTGIPSCQRDQIEKQKQPRWQIAADC